eukprot:Skav235699  [mRNA]  locus=scaffold280:270488:272737:- [translate_table: standard]
MFCGHCLSKPWFRRVPWLPLPGLSLKINHRDKSQMVRCNMAVCVKDNNLYASSFALLMSVVAWCMGIGAIGKVEEAFGSMGSGTILRDSALRSVIHLSFSMILNITSFLCICCSTFHFEQAMKFSFAHTMTSSTAFCVLRIAAFTTFLVQLACSSLMLVGMSSVLTLDFICHMVDASQI